MSREGHMSSRSLWGGFCSGRFSWLLVVCAAVIGGEIVVGVAEAEDASSSLNSLSTETYVRLRDAVAYQVSMGRSLETACAQLRSARSLAPDWPEGPPEQLVAAMYRRLTVPPEVPRSHPRALALIGDRYHDPAYIRPALEAALKKAGVAVAFLYDVRQLQPKLLRHFDLLVVLRDGMLWPNPTEDDPYGDRVFWMTDEQEFTIAAFVWSGGALLALHNATALRRLDDGESLYTRTLGASYAGHGQPGEHYRVHVVTEHPVTHGVRDYPAVDERHWPKLHVDDATLLLQAVAGDKTSLHGFVRTFGAGRVCYLANGHNREILESEPMQTMIRNAAVWCLEEASPHRTASGGASVR